MLNLRLIVILASFLILSGCAAFTRTIYVPHGQAVRLRQGVKKVKVWVKTENEETVASKMDLPEGWYCMPFEDDE